MICRSGLPVFVEPVVDLGFGIERVAEVAGTRRGDPVHRPVCGEQVVGQLFVLSIVIFLHDAKAASNLACNRKSVLD